MKFIITSATLLSCVLAQPYPGPSSYNDETCEIDWIVELQLRFMFGTNVHIDESNILIDIFRRDYQQLELIYLAYHDSFRRLLRDSHGNLRDNRESRLDYYYRRLRLSTEQVIYEASTGPRRCDQYAVQVSTRSISLSVPCRFSPTCLCGGPRRLYQHDCTESIDRYRDRSCVSYTVRVPKSPKEVGSARTLLQPSDNYILRDMILRLYDARISHRPNTSVEILRTHLRRFIRLMHVVRIRRRVRIQTEFRRYDHDLGLLDVNVGRLISDDEYFAETMRRPEMWFDDDADEFEMILQDHLNPPRSENTAAQRSSSGSSESAEARAKFSSLAREHFIRASDRNLEYDLCSETQNLFRRVDSFQLENVEIGHFERALYGYDNPNQAQCRLKNRRLNFQNLFGRRRESSNTTHSRRRSKRFAPDTENNVTIEKLDTVVRQRLMDFALVSIMDRTEANNLNKTLEWSRDFKDLYDQYLNGNWTNVLCENSSLGFDNFLYSKLHRNPNWEKCIGENLVKDKWCSAARRILWKTDSEGQNPWVNESSRPKHFLKDRTTVYEMLNNIPSTDTALSYKADKTNDFYDNDGYYLASIFLTFVQVDPCVGKAHARMVKRDVKKSYKLDWYLDLKGNF